MDKKIKNLINTLTRLGLHKEAEEVGLFVCAQEIFTVKPGTIASDVYRGDLNYKVEVEKENPNLNWNKLQTGQKIILPSYKSFAEQTYPNKNMSATAYAYFLIKKYEDLRLTPYNDGFGNLTIGYGHRISRTESFDSFSINDAIVLLSNDVEKAAQAVRDLVRTKLTQNQFNALVSLIFNVGRSAFAKTNMLTYINMGNFRQAAQEFLDFNIAGNKENAYLAERRNSERELFMRK